MSKLDLIIKALQVSYAHVPGDIADRHHEALVAARELLDQSAEPEPAFKLSDAGADTNIEPFTLYPKGSGMVTMNQPVAWHHPDCAGECIACLIEEVVTEAYGTQGLEYLRKRVNALHQPEQEPVAWRCTAPPCKCSDAFNAKHCAYGYTAPSRKPWVSLSDEEEIELDEKHGDDINAYIDARDAKLKELNG
jgi:hypothetical protein